MYSMRGCTLLRVLTSSLPPAQGRVGLVEVPTQIQALQAEVVSRLLEPEHLAWKVFQLHHLSKAPHTYALAYGATILFSTVSISGLQLPTRLTKYVTAFKALQPHRLLKIDAIAQIQDLQLRVRVRRRCQAQLEGTQETKALL